MNPSQTLPILLLATTLVNGATASIPYVDTIVNGIQFRKVTYVVFLGATDAALTALKNTESDASGSGYTDIAATVYGASGKPALPGATDDNNKYMITSTVSKRYQKPVITVASGSTGASLTVIAILHTPVSGNLDTLLTDARGLSGREVNA